MTRCVFDIEADGFLDTITNIWCIVIYDLQTDKMKSFRPDNLINGILELSRYDTLIGHNIVGYDIPAVRMVIDNRITQFIRQTNVLDTLVTSRYLWPERPWGHSLEDWGTVLGEPKGDFNDWTRFSEEMLTYCEQDVRVNVKILKALEEEYGESIPGFPIYDESVGMRAQCAAYHNPAGD